MLRRLHRHLRAQRLGDSVDVEPLEQLAHGRRTDVRLERVIVLAACLLAQIQKFILIEQLVRLYFLRARIDDAVVRVIDDLLELTQRDVEQIAHRAGQRLEEPDVRDGYGELDVPHALATDARQGDFDAATIADHATITDALVLAAMAFPVLDGTEDALAEEAILLGLERAVVDRLRLGDLAPRPPVAEPLHLVALALLRVLGAADLFRRSDADLNEIKCRASLLAHTAKVNHGSILPVAIAVTVPVLACRAQVHPDAERLQFLHEHVERLRNPRLWQILALHDRLVHAASTIHVVGLDGQDLLQRVRGAIRLERPHFHFSEPLAAELRLAGERLLRHQRIRSDASRVDLVVHEVRELEHVDLADGHRVREPLPRASIAQPHLAGEREPGEPHQLDRRGVHIRFRLGPEHRRQRRQLVRLQHIRALATAELLELLERATQLR